jgi:iron complex transport system permease protein
LPSRSKPLIKPAVTAPATPSWHATPQLEPNTLMAGLGLAVLALAALSLLTGPTGFGLPDEATARWLIIRELRLPRMLFGVLVGAGLGLAGAALQGYLRNPLAEPGLMGVSGGATLGAVLAIHLGIAGQFALALPLAGLAGAALATLSVLALAGGQASPVTLVLAGVAVSAVTAAGTQLALNLSANPFAAAEAVFWMMGSLADRSLVQLQLAAPLMLVGCALLLRLGRTLDALTLGDDVAASLGMDLTSARRQLIAGTALAVGTATAITGMIGFVGLVVPHLLRRHVGGSPSRLLIASALGGAALVLAADIAVRLIAPWFEVRIGVLTAVLGAPFFLWLVVRLREDLAP